MTIRLGTHESPTITSDPAALHVCKQQIASGNKLLYISDTLVSNYLNVLSMTIRLGILLLLKLYNTGDYIIEGEK